MCAANQARVSVGVMRFVISEHQRGAHCPFRTCEEYQLKHSWFHVRRRQLNRDDSGGLLARVDSRRTHFALRHFDGSLTTRLQSYRSVRAELRVSKNVERLAVPRRGER